MWNTVIRTRLVKFRTMTPWTISSIGIGIGTVLYPPFVSTIAAHVSFTCICIIFFVVFLPFILVSPGSRSLRSIVIGCNDTQIDKLEDLIIDSTFKKSDSSSSTCVKRTTSFVVSRIPVSIRSICSVSDGCKPRLLYIHGTSSSALGFLEPMKRLASTFDIYSIELPGFGRSTTTADRGRMLRMSNTEICDFYGACFREFIETEMDGRPVCIVAHSFGGFLASEFSSRYPEYVDRLILVSCAGVMPIFGEWGNYWGVMFWASLPQSLLRTASYISVDVVVIIFLRWLRMSSFAHYYFRLLSHRLAYGDRLVGRFIQIGSVWSQWRQPTLCRLLRLNKPLAFIYGEHDTIMPSHQGTAFVRISGAPVPHIVVKGAGHSPHSDDTVSFCKCLVRAYDDARAPGKSAIELSRTIEADGLLSCFVGSYDLHTNSETMDALYSYLFDLSDNQSITEDDFGGECRPSSGTSGTRCDDGSLLPCFPQSQVLLTETGTLSARDGRMRRSRGGSCGGGGCSEWW